MTAIGAIKRVKELGIRRGHKIYIWQACVDCGKERWQATSQKKRPGYTGCCSSCTLRRMNSKVGGHGYCWKGGRKRDKQGYISVWVSPDDFFYSMTGRNQHYVFEHRLVMAKHLNRCLLSWEVVHHKNGIKDDNRLENLQLLPGQTRHLVDTQVKRHIQKLEKRIETLEARVTFLEAENTLLQLTEGGNKVVIQ